MAFGGMETAGYEMDALLVKRISEIMGRNR
jgi:hypothetical protein